MVYLNRFLEQEVNASLAESPIVAILGPRQCGKSTLMKCLFGIYQKDEGEIYLEGEKVEIKDPFDALGKGIAMVHQELQPILDRSIAENIYVGRYPVKKVGPLEFIDHAKLYADAQKVLDELGLDFDPKAKLQTLTASQMQLVEIAKAVSADAKMIILDEPTSSLTSKEVQTLFKIVNKLRDRGCGMIYISHKMDEILRISDEVTIMRDGQYIGTWPAKDLTIDFIIAKEVGRELSKLYPPKDNVPGEVILKVDNFTSPNPKSFQNCSFEVKRGEILGIRAGQRGRKHRGLLLPRAARSFCRQ